MKHNMRRHKQMLPMQECIEILASATNGVLSLTDKDGQPYGVPLSFAFDGHDSIYFHSAATGHKIDCIAACRHCSFCVIDQDMIMPEEFTSYFRSVIVAGQISIVSGHAEIIRGLRMLCDKYSPGIDPTAEIDKCLNRVKILRLSIDHISGKEAIELTRSRRTESI